MNGGSSQRKPKRFFFLRIFFLLAGIGGLFMAFIIAVCVLDTHREEEEWNTLKTVLAKKGLYLEKDLMFPPKPPDEQNFAGIPFLSTLSEDKVGNVDVFEIWNSLTNVHMPYMLSDLPDLSWRDAYMWNPEDIRLILLTRNAVLYPEPPVSAEGNLLLFECFKPQMLEIEEAVERPFCKFPIFFEMGPQYPYLHLGVLNETVLLFSARAVTYLDLGKTDEALNDIILSWKVAQRLGSDQTILGAMAVHSSFLYSLQPLWQGIARHQWNTQQLEKMQKELAGFNFIQLFKTNQLFEIIWTAGMNEVVETVYLTKIGIPLLQGIEKIEKFLPIDNISVRINSVVEALFSKVPVGWIRMNLAHLAETGIDYISNVYLIEDHRIDPDVVREQMEVFQSLYEDTLNPDRIIVKNFKQSLFSDQISQKAAEGQAFIDMASIACIMERFYLKHQRYPESVDAISQLSATRFFRYDIVTGDPYIFIKTLKSFSLYSLGWDKLNNFGQIKKTASGMGDWIWPASDHNSQIDLVF